MDVDDFKLYLQKVKDDYTTFVRQLGDLELKMEKVLSYCKDILKSDTDSADLKKELSLISTLDPSLLKDSNVAK